MLLETPRSNQHTPKVQNARSLAVIPGDQRVLGTMQGISREQAPSQLCTSLRLCPVCTCCNVTRCICALALLAPWGCAASLRRAKNASAPCSKYGLLDNSLCCCYSGLAWPI